MAGHHRHVDTLTTGDSADKLTDASRPDDQQSISRVQSGLMNGMERDRDRFNQRSVGQPDAGRERDETARVHPDLIGQAAIDRNAVHSSHTGTAELVLTGGATVALAARNRGLDGHRRAVVQHAGELVTEGDGQAEREQVQVGSADARRRDPNGDSLARRRGHIDDRDPAIDAAHGPHRADCTGPRHWARPLTPAGKLGRVLAPAIWRPKGNANRVR
jgi:hypothetical protein